MKKLSFILLVFCLSFSTSPTFSETLTMDDLVERNDLFFKKFTDIPFTGEISNKRNDGVLVTGKFSKGKKHGIWRHYHENGQLASKVYYNKGKSIGHSKPSVTLNTYTHLFKEKAKSKKISIANKHLFNYKNENV